MKKDDIKRKFPVIYKTYKKFRSISNHIKYHYYKSINESKYPNKLAKIYKKKTGEKLNWDYLNTYNEKMQWAKLYDSNPLKTKLADKYLVREWVGKIIGNEYLIPLLGVWEKFDEIDFLSLPKQFVLKTNNGSGTNIIVKDKNALDLSKAKKKINKWLKTNFAYKNGFELHYRDIKPKILAEQFLEDSNGELKDYKFLCFHGKVYYCWIDIDRFGDHRRNIYDLNWKLQEWTQNYPNSDMEIPRPQNFELMINLAEKLSKNFSHVRVDFYNVDGKIYFGEMTFTSESGFSKIEPYKYNQMLGALWKLPINK